MSLQPDRIAGETFVRRVEYRDETASTSDLALALTEAEAESGSSDTPILVLTNRQTAGRGRGTNQWWAGDGALTFSLILDTRALEIPASAWPRISLTAGLSVCRTLLEVIPDGDVRLKWPNDVFLQARKVCGILVENSPAQPKLVIAGMGINVNNSLQAGPQELHDQAISMADAIGREFDRTDILVSVLRQLEHHLAALRDETLSLSDQWRDLCMLEGRTLRVEYGSRSLTGVCQGIADDGTLLLRTESGIERCAGGIVARIL